MFTRREVLRSLLGILLAIGALCMGWVFWVWFMLSFGTIFGVWVVPVMLGYIYIVIGLARFKGWAWGMFITIVILAISWTTIDILIGGPDIKLNFMEGLSHSIFWISLIAIPVFGISALIRKIARRLKEKT